MKPTFVTLCVATGLGLLDLAAFGAEAAKVPATPTEKASYGVGVDLIRNYKRKGVEIDVEMVIRGIHDAAAGGRLAVNEKELRQVQADFLSQVRRTESTWRRSEVATHQQEGRSFLGENAKRKGVLTLASGLQYEVLKEGTGKRPSDADVVQVSYRGTLIDGREFDTTVEGKPVTLKVHTGPGTIAGMSEGLKLMSVGSKYKLFIPAKLAYGSRGVGRIVGPNETVIYEVELVGIQ